MPAITSRPIKDSPYKEYLYHDLPIAHSTKRPIENGRLRFFLVAYPTPFAHIITGLVNHYRETDNFKMDILNAIKETSA